MNMLEIDGAFRTLSNRTTERTAVELTRSIFRSLNLNRQRPDPELMRETRRIAREAGVEEYRPAANHVAKPAIALFARSKKPQRGVETARAEIPTPSRTAEVIVAHEPLRAPKPAQTRVVRRSEAIPSDKANAMDENTLQQRAAYATQYIPVLSARSQKVLALMAQGMGNASIASELGVAPITIPQYVSRIYGTLKLSDVASLSERRQTAARAYAAWERAQEDSLRNASKEAKLAAARIRFLSHNERTTLRLLSEGKRMKIIARECGVSSPTISLRIGKITKTLGLTRIEARNPRLQALIAAFRLSQETEGAVPAVGEKGGQGAQRTAERSSVESAQAPAEPKPLAAHASPAAPVDESFAEKPDPGPAPAASQSSHAPSGSTHGPIPAQALVVPLSERRNILGMAFAEENGDMPGLFAQGMRPEMILLHEGRRTVVFTRRSDDTS